MNTILTGKAREDELVRLGTESRIIYRANARRLREKLARQAQSARTA